MKIFEARCKAFNTTKDNRDGQFIKISPKTDGRI